MLTYSLAAIHLIVTLAADFPFGVVKRIPFNIHGGIERLVGPSPITLPFISGSPELLKGLSRNDSKQIIGCTVL